MSDTKAYYFGNDANVAYLLCDKYRNKYLDYEKE